MKRKLLLSLMLLCVSLMTLCAQTENVPQTKQVNQPMPDDSVVIDGDVVYTIAKPIAQFKGGEQKLMDFIIANTSISRAKPKAEHGNGMVLVQYYIAKDGSVKNVHIVKGMSPEIDMEAMRVIKMMPNWIPAQRNGQNVCMKMTMPIRFKW